MTLRSIRGRAEELNLQDLMIITEVEIVRRFISNVPLRIAIEPTDLRLQEEVPPLQPEVLVAPAEVPEQGVLAEEEDPQEVVVVAADNKI